MNNSSAAIVWIQSQIAFDIALIMNDSLDPCDDFYKFACGNYDVFQLPDDADKVTRFGHAQYDTLQDLKDVLEDNDTLDDLPSTRLVRTFYQSCMDVDSMETLGLNPLKSLIKKYGGWPVVEGHKWNQTKYNWIKTNALLAFSVSEHDFLKFDQNAHFKNSSKRIIVIDQASFGMEKRDYYLDEKNKNATDSYLGFMISTAVQLGASEANAKREMKDVLSFETALAQATVRDEDRKDKTTLYRPMTVAQLKKRYPDIDFATWFKTAATEFGFQYGDDDEINLTGEPFLEKLPPILKRFSPRTLANYQIWSLIMSVINYLPPSLRVNHLRFKKALYGIAKFGDRWEDCAQSALDVLEIPVGAVYVRKYFTDDMKENAENMVRNIREAMKSTLKNLHWMDEETKRYAQTKLSEMIQSIAYPSPDIDNDTWVMRDFAQAKLDNTTYLDNYISLTNSTYERLIKTFHDPINRTEWGVGIAIANAYYTLETNSISVPAGILRYPIYNSLAPNYFNYGRIGDVMGHEVTHAFDDEGRQYGAYGNLDVWWTNQTLEKFSNGTRCFVDQYSNIVDQETGLSLNGENTLSENIADNGGIKLAYKAYKKDQKNITSLLDERNTFLRSLFNYTMDQLFFISFAQTWCVNSRTESLKDSIITDEHSPERYRVNVPLQNFHEFAATFNCSVGSAMNPKKKCQIW